MFHASCNLHIKDNKRGRKITPRGALQWWQTQWNNINMWTTRPKGGWASFTHLQRQWWWSTCSFSHSYNLHKTSIGTRPHKGQKQPKIQTQKWKNQRPMGWVGLAHLPPKVMARSTQTQPTKCKHKNKKAKGKFGGGWCGRSCSPLKVTARSMHSTSCSYNLHRTTTQEGGAMLLWMVVK